MGTAGGLWRGFGGHAMNTPTLNLLRYPRRTRGPLSPPLAWALTGAVLGVLLAWGWKLWTEQRLTDVQAQRVALQTQLNAQTQAQAGRASETERQRLLARLQQREQQWLGQRQWLRQLHAQLAQEARTQGLRLQHWQADGQRLELQVGLPPAQVQAVPELLQRLSLPGAPAWTLLSLGNGADTGVQLGLAATMSAQPEASGPLVHKVGP